MKEQLSLIKPASLPVHLFLCRKLTGFAIISRLTTESALMTKDAKSTQAIPTQSDETKDLIAKGHAMAQNSPQKKDGFTEDKRETARHEHTNQFTNRASSENN